MEEESGEEKQQNVKINQSATEENQTKTHSRLKQNKQERLISVMPLG